MLPLTTLVQTKLMSERRQGALDKGVVTDHTDVFLCGTEPTQPSTERSRDRHILPIPPSLSLPLEEGGAITSFVS